MHYQVKNDDAFKLKTKRTPNTTRFTCGLPAVFSRRLETEANFAIANFGKEILIFKNLYAFSHACRWLNHSKTQKSANGFL